MMKSKELYDKVFELLENNNNHCFDIGSLKEEAENHLFGIELVEKYGLDINPLNIYSTLYNEIRSNMYIVWLDGKTRYIYASDNKKQPNNEHFLQIEFPTGSFIFGDENIKNVFDDFFSELKTYNPKFSDSLNNYLYFSLDNAKDIFNAYDSIFEKYKKIYEVEYKQRKIDKLKRELEQIEN